MSALRTIDRSLVCLILVLSALALGACSRTVAETAATPTPPRPVLPEADASPPGNERYPADVYRPSDYTVRSVTEVGSLLTISGDAPESAPVLFAQARTTMPMQGWKETGAEESAAAHVLAFEKSGYEAELTFIPNGNATRLQMQLRSPGRSTQSGMD